MMARLSGLALATAIIVRAAPQNPTQPFDAKWGAWVSAVNSHVPGEWDAAVDALARWPADDLLSLRASLKKAQGLDGVLKRGAVLHADIAMLHRRDAGYDLPSDGRNLVVVGDGLRVGASAGTYHWAIGRMVLAFVGPDPSRDDDVRLWYRATAAFLQYRNDYAELEPHLANGLALFPNDPVLLVTSGTLHEAYAEPRMQNLALSPAGKQVVWFGTTDSERGRAERIFRQALAIDPAFGEARVRLAHVLGTRAYQSQAAAEAQRALAGHLSPLFRYYALLFLGRARYALGQRDLARAAFERAAVLYPGAQSPHLALSELARDRGDRAGVLEEMFFLSLPANTTTRDDPWWVYHKTHVPGVEDLVTQLRTAVRQ